MVIFELAGVTYRRPQLVRTETTTVSAPIIDRDDEYDKPRSFTLNQIRDLVLVHLQGSELKKNFVAQNNLLGMHEENFEDIAQYRRQLSEDLKEEFSRFSDQITKNHDQFERYCLRNDDIGQLLQLKSTFCGV